jgi:peptidoglycan/LPS O-acetylase OafA/YrhL
MNYDNSISLTRVLAMIFIVVCHCASMFGKTAIAGFFDVGVPIFFIISGYLASSKIIDNKAHWIKKKLLRLYIPLSLWVAVYVIVKLIKRELYVSFFQTLLLMFNMQGLNHILKWIPLGIGPWFFTVIELCYFFFLAYDSIKIKNISKYSVVFLLCFFMFVTILQFFGINLGGIFIFFLGCFLCRRKEYFDKLTNKWAIAPIIGSISVIMRLVGKVYFDNTTFYDNVLSSVTHSMLALSIFIFLKYCDNRFNKAVCSIASFPVIKWLDKISVYVYLTHTWFLGTLICNVFDYGNIFVGFLLLIICTLSISSIFYYTNVQINKLIKL